MSSTTVCTPHAGQTRDCLDPWKMAYVKSDGDVTLCCWSKPVGNVKDGTISDLLHNPASREMRRGLLTGEMPTDCVVCPARALVPVPDFRKKVEEFVADDGRQELLALRSRLHGVQETLVQQKRHHERIAAEYDGLKAREKELSDQVILLAERERNLNVHVGNLELQGEHLRRHVAILVEDAHAIAEGRAPILRIVYRWTRGRLRSLLGRRPATPAG